MPQWVIVLELQAWHPEFNPRKHVKLGRERGSVKLLSAHTHAVAHAVPQSHTPISGFLTHTQIATQSLHTLSHILDLQQTYTLTYTLTHFLFCLTHTLSHTHTLTLPFLIHTVSNTLLYTTTLSHNLSLTHTLFSLTYTLSHTIFQTFSQTHILSHPKPTPTVPLFLQQGHAHSRKATPPNSAAPYGPSIKHVSLWGPFLFQPPHLGSWDRTLVCLNFSPSFLL